jgi:hypothetical protein
MRAPIPGLAALGLVLSGLAAPAAGQDATYWTIQYGPVAQLLGGQVVGSTRDLSATYYNPGGLALAKQPAFLLSVQSVLLQGVDVSAARTGVFPPTSSWTLGIAPSLIAGTFPEKWFGERTRLAWSYLTRQQFNVVLDQGQVGNLPGSGARYGAESLFDQRMTESWGGLTLSRRVSDRWGVGVTWYGAYRGQQTRKEENATLSQPGGGLTALAIETFDYYYWRTLAKVGAAWDAHGTLRLGVAVTTPSLGLVGGGRAGYTKSVTGFSQDATPVESLSNGIDDNAQAHYRSSWAIAGGAAWRMGQTNLNVSGEWFAPVSEYAVLTTTANEGAQAQQLTQQLKGIFNAGVAVEHKFEGGTAVYAAAATDFNASVGPPGLGVSAASWNLLHLTAGTSFQLIGNRLTLGASYGFGSSHRQLGLQGLPPDTPVLGVRPAVDVHYYRVTFILGFVLGG